MSSAHSSSTTSTQQPGKTVGASAQAGTQPQKTILVSGEQGDSVGVQSQLATSHVAGDVQSKSNIGQVVKDLGGVHTHSSQWLDNETAKVSQWGQAEIQKVLAQTKAMEEALVAGAKEKQKALDASHQGELAKLVQEMDLRKAAELKELEDGLQRQIQATLTSSKNDINRVESEMNNKKMELLKQSQLKSAKEVDTLSNLVVETKLVPSQTRTIIETATNTGNVIAVATGGNISTGSAQAESYNSQKIAAIPNAGELRQAHDITRGDMIRDADGRKVGEGAIVNTQTNVQEQQALAAGQRGNDVTVQARPLQQHGATTGAPIATGATTGTTTGTAGHHNSGLLSQSELQRHAATHPVVDRSAVAGHDGTMPARAVVNPEPQVHHETLAHHNKESGLLHHNKDSGLTHHDKDSALHSHDAAASSATGEHHQHGLICKVKHALGIDKSSSEKHAHDTVHAGEPRSTDSTRRNI